MGYLIELSFLIKNLPKFTENKHKIIDRSKKNNCVFFYENYEYSKKKVKNIFTFNFNEEDDIISFIKYIKDFPKIRIDSISTEEPYILLYASKEYIKLMDIYKAKEFIQKRKDGDLYKYSPNLLKML
jgi:hypothetical protein